MPEITVIKAPAGTRLAKIITPQGTEPVDDLPYLLHFEPGSADNLNELEELLQWLRSQPDLCIIRGRLKPDTEQPCRRLLHADPATKDPATLDDLPCAWVLLDFDSVACPESIDFAREPHRAAMYLRNQLPEPFRAAGAVWRASSSAGIKEGIRLHLWFLLSTALDARRLNHWLAPGNLLHGVKVDRKLFQCTQPHFTADPEFRGRVDPMVRRIGRLDGSERVIVPQPISDYFDVRKVTPAPSGSYSDPLLAAAVHRWAEANPVTEYTHTERFDCPACLSPNSCAVQPDGSGKVFCHAAGHAERCGDVGTPVSGGYIGSRVEFELCVSSKGLRAKLAELGFYSTFAIALPPRGALAAAAAMGDVVEGIVTDPDDSPAAKELVKAAKELSAACAAIRRTGSGKFEALAASCFKWVPRCLAVEDVTRALLSANLSAPTGAGMTQPDAEAALERAAARGFAAPHVAKRVSLTLACDEFGNPLSTQANVVTLCFGLATRLALDTRALRMVWREAPPWHQGPWTQRTVDDGDAALLSKWFSDSQNYTSATTGQIEAAFIAIAQQNPFDPIRDYLDGLPRCADLDEARTICQSWLIQCAGVDDSPYSRAVSMRWLIAAVRRVYEPGCMSREVLTLIGVQNQGKSKLFRALCPSYASFKDDMSMKNEQTMKQGLLGAWIVELAEVDKWLKQDRHGDLKAFISTSVDKFRLPYARHESLIPRCSVLSASTNEERPLVDPTGNTRFNVLKVGQDLDAEGVAECRDVIWGAALALLESGEPSYLQGDEKLWALAAQEEHRAIDDVEAWLGEFLETPHPMPTTFGASPGTREVSPFAVSPEQLDASRRYQWVTMPQLREAARVRGVRADDRRLGLALRSLHWEREQRRNAAEGQRLRIFSRPNT